MPPAQMHVSPSLKFNDIAPAQMKTLLQYYNIFVSHYPSSINRKASFVTELKRLFNYHFTVQLSNAVEQRALAERLLVLTIRPRLKQDQLVLRRTADQLNLFYLGDARRFEAQAQDDLNHNSSYERIVNIADPTVLKAQLDEIGKSIDTALLRLRAQGRIPEHHLATMAVKRANIAFPCLYYLPESGQPDLLQLRPFITPSRYAPIKPLAYYLDDLLRPLFESSTQSTLVLNGMDFIGKLAHFDEYSLLPQTIFATFKVIDVYMRVSHDSIGQALGRFLTHALTGNRLQSLTIETIQELVGLVLRNNLFTYNDHLYRHVRGSPVSLPLTRTLVNIYLHDWQMTFVKHLNLQSDLYLRYHDTAFVAWQQPLERLQAVLQELDRKHPDLHIDYTIGTTVHFLGVQVENQLGQLHTRVYRDPNMPRLALPFVIGHPRLLYRQWYQWALTRSARYCTSMEEFDHERIQVEMTLLAQGFSLEFVELGMNTFLKKYFAVDLLTSPDDRHYSALRQRLFGLIPLEKQHHQKQEEWKLKKQLVHLQYLYDWGPRCQFNQQFKLLWFSHIANDPILKNKELKLKLDALHCYPLNILLSKY